MTTETFYLRLRVTDPRRWHAVAQTWRRWAELAGRLAAEFAPHLVRLGRAWSGAAARAAVERLTGLRRRLVLFRLRCWQADQVASEFAVSLDRARALLSRALAAATPAGLMIDDHGVVRRIASPTIASGHPGASPALPPAASAVAADLAAALTVAAQADRAAAAGMHRIAAYATAAPPSIPADRPDCTAPPAEIRRWWAGLSPAQREWLLATAPAELASLDGLPAADRDAANRLLLDDRRAELERALAGAHGRERERLLALRHGLDDLTDRLAGESGPRAYLLRLDLAEEGRAVVALGNPDHADDVLTHVPGMTADLASFGGELSRAERVAVRAAEIDPAASTSAVLWLDYDAPDFVDEAASGRRAAAGVPALRRFQDGLRAGHDGPQTARQTVLGHSYGSLLVGKAAAGPGMDADSVVFVGSPGVGVDRAADLHVPAGQVWSSTSRSDVIQYVAVAPDGLLRDLAVADRGHPLLAFARPEDDLWFGHNPSDPGFGGRVFASQPDGGHVGYWDRGRPALDALAAITLGRTP